MAKTIYLPDGDSWTVLGDEGYSLRRIVDKYLGRDCVELLDEVISASYINGYDNGWEDCCDGVDYDSGVNKRPIWWGEE